MPYYDIRGEEDYDLMGALEIRGDDDDFEMLGAMLKSNKPAVRKAAVRALASRPSPARGVPSAVAVRQVSPSTSRRLILPIDTGAVAIAGGATATVNLSSSQAFRATQLRLDPVASPNWLITDVKVGRKSQFLGTGSIPATVFSAGNPDCAVSFDTAQATETIQIILANQSGAASRLTGAMIGETVE